MKNNVLASTVLSLTVLLALTSCTSGEASAPVIETASASAEAVQAPANGAAAVACTVLGITTLFELTSCDSGEPSAPVTVTETVSVEADPQASESTQTSTEAVQATGADEGRSDGKVGQKLVNGGVTLTVTKVEIVESIPMNRTGYETGTELGKITHERPGKGGKFLRVDTLVENTSKVSMDLTCGWVIEAKALDSQKREFDSIADLYYLETNPGCNDGLQPGLKVDMSYVYLLPEDADATSFKFRNLNMEAETEYTTITFDQPVK